MAPAAENRLRRWLLWIVAVIFLGSLVELVLEEHTKETIQWIPFVLCGLGLIVVALVLRHATRGNLLALRGVMALTALGGLFGTALHLYYNYTFELDIRPNAATGELLVRTFKGANPLLAPGILTFGALIALVATYAHPALRPGERE